MEVNAKRVGITVFDSTTIRPLGRWEPFENFSLELDLVSEKPYQWMRFFSKIA